MSSAIKILGYLLNEVDKTSENISESDYNKLLQLKNVCMSQFKLCQFYKVYTNIRSKDEKFFEKIGNKISDIEEMIKEKKEELKIIPESVIQKDNYYSIVIYNEILDELNKLVENQRTDWDSLYQKIKKELEEEKKELIDKCIDSFEKSNLELLTFFRQSLIKNKNADSMLSNSVEMSELNKIFCILNDLKRLENVTNFIRFFNVKEQFLNDKLVYSIMIKYEKEIKEFVSILEKIERNKYNVENFKERIKNLNEIYNPYDYIKKFVNFLLSKKQTIYKEMLYKDIEESENMIRELEKKRDNILDNAYDSKLFDILNIYINSKCTIDKSGLFIEWDFSKFSLIYGEEIIKCLNYFTSCNTTAKLLSSEIIFLKDIYNNRQKIDDELNKLVEVDLSEEEKVFLVTNALIIKNINIMMNAKNKDGSKPIISLYILKALSEIESMNEEQLKEAVANSNFDFKQEGFGYYTDYSSSYSGMFEEIIKKYNAKLDEYSDVRGLAYSRINKKEKVRVKKVEEK